MKQGKVVHEYVFNLSGRVFVFRSCYKLMQLNFMSMLLWRSQFWLGWFLSQNLHFDQFNVEFEPQIAHAVLLTALQKNAL